jgi:Transposase IS66 family
MAEGENSPKIDPAEVEVLIDRFKQNKLNQREAELIVSLLRTLLYLLAQLQDKKATIQRLQEMIFGRKSEKRKKEESKLPEDQAKPEEAGEANPGDAKNQADGESTKGSEISEEEKANKRGHGRIPTSAYRGAKKVHCRHPELSSGSPCPRPDCDGKVYRLFRPHEFLQFTGAPVINATCYSQETLKCKVCDREYEAPLPPGIKPQKFDETADAAIVIDHYLAATPAYRRSGLQELSGIPLPISIIYERCVAVAEAVLPIYKEMEKAAANARILYGDDTWVRILECGFLISRVKKNQICAVHKRRQGYRVLRMLEIETYLPQSLPCRATRRPRRNFGERRRFLCGRQDHRFRCTLRRQLIRFD